MAWGELTARLQIDIPLLEDKYTGAGSQTARRQRHGPPAGNLFTKCLLKWFK